MPAVTTPLPSSSVWYQAYFRTSAAWSCVIGGTVHNMPPVQILHVGWGFSPWRPGGLIYYAEDLMAAQARRGHVVTYLLSGRHYPRVSGPRVKRWEREGVTMVEVVNPPIVVGLEQGTRAPERDLEEPRLEAIFARALRDARPDVVHVQELLGHPSSILEL